MPKVARKINKRSEPAHTRQETPSLQTRRRFGYLLTFIFGAACTASVLLALSGGEELKSPSHIAASPRSEQSDTTAPHMPTSYYELLGMSSEQLVKVDVALVNLLCAKGLPGTETLDIPATLAKLDEWAKRAPPEINRHLYRAHDPRYTDIFHGSENRVRVYMMVQVLQEDCGVKYNPSRIYDPDFRDSRDMFIHGMLPGGNGGTCASMPVLYTAVGRRLGFPIKLVQAREHLLCRWDDDKEKFNIEGAGNGLSFEPDDYYHTWPKPLSKADLASGVFLTSMSPSDELAVFLNNRATCLKANGNLVEARAAFAESHRLQPRDANTFNGLRIVCGAGQSNVYAHQGPAADAWTGQQMPPDPADPTPKITMPGVTPTAGVTNPRIGQIK